MSALRTAAEEDDPRRLLLLYSLRDPRKPAFGDELRGLAQRERIDVVLVPSQPDDDWTGASGRISRDLLEQLLPANRRRWSYFVCGPPGMTDTAESALGELGIARGSIRVERFALA
jgi:ferredoxin-NADP reductase